MPHVRQVIPWLWAVAALATSARAQLQATFTALGGSVSATGGPTQTILAGTDLRPGLSLATSGTVGTNSGNATLSLSQLTTGTGGFEFSLLARADSQTGGVSDVVALQAMLTVQSLRTTEVVLDLFGSGSRFQGGAGTLSIDIDNDGIVEATGRDLPRRLHLSVGPSPRQVRLDALARVDFFSYSTGVVNLSLRVTPGRCDGALVGTGCRGTMALRETIDGDVELRIITQRAAGSSRLFVLFGATSLPMPALIGGTCELGLLPTTAWYIPFHTGEATLTLPVPRAALPFRSLVQVAQLVTATGSVETTPLLRFDCH